MGKIKRMSEEVKMKFQTEENLRGKHGQRVLDTQSN